MKGVILAAGLGMRLRPVTNFLPKALLEIDGRALIEYSLEALRENGIREVVIVGGYRHQAIRDRLGEICLGVAIAYVMNEEYAKTGSMYSLSQARPLLENDDILLLESDLLYAPEAVTKVLESKFENVTLAAPMSGSGDEVFIFVDEEQRIIGLGKNVPSGGKNKAIGELVGISKLSREFLPRLFERADEDYEKGEVNYHYEECIFATSRLGNPVYAVLCEGLAWTEIDNENDLRRAQQEIYPKIRNRLRSLAGSQDMHDGES
jgi:choline kinase